MRLLQTLQPTDTLLSIIQPWKSRIKLCRSFPFVSQHLGPTLTSSPVPFLDMGQLLDSVGNSPVEGHELQYRRDPGGPQKTPSNSASPQKLHYPYRLSDLGVGGYVTHLSAIGVTPQMI